jgi:tetratricopeptide (TPR) repeat protein
MKPGPLILLTLILAGCVPPKPAPPSEEATIVELPPPEVSPRRAASLRLVEEGRRDLQSSLFERGAQKFAKALEVDPGNPHAYFFLGLARFRVNRFEEAAELFSRAGNLFADSGTWKAEAMAYRGESLEKSGRIEDGRKEFEEALRIDPLNVRAAKGFERLQ